MAWALVLWFCPAPGRSDSPVDQQIRFWEARLTRDPEDHITPTKLAAAYVFKARESAEPAYYGKADSVLKKALVLSPDYPPALSVMSSVHAARHRFKEALACAERLIRLTPDDATGYGLAGDAWLELGEVRRAGDSYRKLRELSDALPAYCRLAQLSFIQGDTAGALSLFDQGIKAGERDRVPAESLAWAQTQFGELCFRTGDFTNAELHYLKALEIMPQNPFALDHVAELRAAQTRYDEAIAAYQKLIKQVDRPEFCQALGDVFVFMGKPAEAAPWHERALGAYLKAAEAGEAHYYHHLAAFYSDVREQGREAVLWARKDLELRESVFAWEALAWALYRDGQWEEAARAAKKAVAFGTQDPHLLYHAGLVYQRSGQSAQGRELLRRALSVNPRYLSFHVHR